MSPEEVQHEHPRVVCGVHIDAYHPEEGAYRFDVHGLDCHDGTAMLIAFTDMSRERQFEIVTKTAENFGFSVIELGEEDLEYEIVAHFADAFRQSPDKNTSVLEVVGRTVRH